jgi:hypothetical protein
MFVESAGHTHNVFNFDKTTPAVTLATWFLLRPRRQPHYAPVVPFPQHIDAGSVAHRTSRAAGLRNNRQVT